MLRKIHQSKAPLKIIIVGCGNVGSTLVEQLSSEGNDITIIDQDPARIANITNLYDVMSLVGNGATFNVQQEAGIKEADLFIAVTDSDEMNLLCCTVAKQGGHCATVARVRTPDYSEELPYLREKLGLALIINPDLEAAREIARLFYMPKALEVTSFAHNQAEIIKFKVPDKNLISGKSISEYARFVNSKILICAVERDNEVQIPNGDFVIQPGDVVSFVVPRRSRKSLLKDLAIKASPIRTCMIVGGGRSAFYLTQQLLHMGVKVKIIEVNKQRCEILSEKLPGAIIINGDGTDETLLKEEGIDSTDAFVSLTGHDEQNVILTLYAKSVTDTKVITKIKRTNFRQVISNLDLGSVVYPRYITSESIIAYARAMRASIESDDIETMCHMYDWRVESLEFRVKRDCQVVGKEIRELNLKPDLMIALINRKGKVMLPTGGDSIQVGDTVIVVTTNTGFSEIDDILK